MHESTNVESHLDEGALVGGEQLLEAGAVEGLFELEKHLWLATIGGYEVELKVSPLKVLGGTCAQRHALSQIFTASRITRIWIKTPAVMPPKRCLSDRVGRVVLKASKPSGRYSSTAENVPGE